MNEGEIIPDKTDSEIRWLNVNPIFKQNLGSQKCYLPNNLLSRLNVGVGKYISISFGEHKLVCCTDIWKEQTEALFQADDTVTVGESTVLWSKRSEALSLNAFRKLKVEWPKQIHVSLVVRNYEFRRQYVDDQTSNISFIRDALSRYAIVPGCTIKCCYSKAFEVLGLELIIVKNCKLDNDSVGLISSKTIITVEEIVTKTRYMALNSVKIKPEVLGGLEKQRKLLEDIIKLPFNNIKARKQEVAFPKCALLIGLPGTGKTSLIRNVAHECQASFIELSASSICRSRPGESSALLKDIFEEAMVLSDEGLCVFFIDELDGLFTNKESRGHGKSILCQLVTLMDKARFSSNLVIVGATNMPDILDASLRCSGRFDYEIYFDIPTKNDRKSIIKILTSEFCTDNLNIESVAQMTVGYVGADLQLVCQEILMAKISTNTVAGGKIAITEQDFENSLKMVRPSAHRSSFVTCDFKSVAWDDIGGLDETKLKLKQSVVWPKENAADFDRLGISWPKGILLYGPPGCCKTTLVKAVATACNASFLSASAAQIYSPFVGDSEKAVSEIFHHARASAPSIVFLDEIDSIVGNRCDDGRRGVNEKVLSTLLNEMDGIGLKHGVRTTKGFENDKEIIVIAATNRPELLDPAILRPGRFDRIIYVPEPDEKGREQILKILISKMPTTNIEIERISKQTVNFTGADLENLCREAALQAIKSEGMDVANIEQRHFDKVLETMQSSLSQQQIKRYRSIVGMFSYK